MRWKDGFWYDEHDEPGDLELVIREFHQNKKKDLSDSSLKELLSLLSDPLSIQILFDVMES